MHHSRQKKLVYILLLLIHYYNYGNDGWDWRIYPRPRFASEYGFQSYPSFQSLSNVSLPQDWYYPRNQFLAHRQHHTFGDFEIQASVRRHMNLPAPGLQEAFQDIIYLSQITQAMSVKSETEHYRRGRSSLQADGRGLTMGALYWQLNDIWPAPSWASIDYGGKWKMLHHFARNFFAHVLVSPYLEKDVLRVFVVSDLIRSLSNLTLRVYVFKWDSFVPTCIVDVHNYTQLPQTALEVFSAALEGTEGLLAKGSCQDRPSCFLYMELLQGQGGQDKALLASNFQVLAGFNEALALTKANIQIANITSESEYSFLVEFTSDAIAPFVWLDTQDLDGEFSDNGFFLVYPTISVNFQAKRPTTTQELQEKITIKSLMDVKT